MLERGLFQHPANIVGGGRIRGLFPRRIANDVHSRVASSCFSAHLISGSIDLSASPFRRQQEQHPHMDIDIDQLKAQLKAAGYKNQSAIAEAIDSNQSAVSSALRGKNDKVLARIVALLKAKGAEGADLTAGRDAGSEQVPTTPPVQRSVPAAEEPTGGGAAERVPPKKGAADPAGETVVHGELDPVDMGAHFDDPHDWTGNALSDTQLALLCGLPLPSDYE